MQNATADPWAIGTLNKTGLWSFYAFTNLVGSLLCLIPIRMIYRSRQRTPGDVFVCLLCLGCILMSVPCGIQCAVNLFSSVWGAAPNRGEFQGGTRACDLEAFFHVSAIMMQFYSTALIAWNFHRSIVHQRVVSVEQALKISVVLSVLAEAGTAIIGRWSRIYLVPSGAYCFYAFDSPVMAYWMIPTLLACSVLICALYYRIYKTVQFAEKKVAPLVARANPENRPSPVPPSPGQGPPSQTNKFAAWNRASRETHNQKQIKVAKRFFLFVLVLLIGWFPALIATVYELVHGTMAQSLDTFVGVDGSLHTWFIPIIYAYKPGMVRDCLIWLCEPQAGDPLSGVGGQGNAPPPSSLPESSTLKTTKPFSDVGGAKFGSPIGEPAPAALESVSPTFRTRELESGPQIADALPA